MLVGGRIEQSGEVGGEPDLRDDHGMIGLGRQRRAEHRRGIRGRARAN